MTRHACRTSSPLTKSAIIYWELAGVVAIILCAVLMARGVWYPGA